MKRIINTKYYRSNHHLYDKLSFPYVFNSIRLIFNGTVMKREKYNFLCLTIDRNNSIGFSKMYSTSSESKSNKKKELEQCVTEINGETTIFTPGDYESHPRSEEISAEMDRMADDLIKHGHPLDSYWTSHGKTNNKIFSSDKLGHSEILAVGLCLIQKPSPSFIQLTNNLRICEHCHEFMKGVAKLRKCEIVLRDPNRIHRFTTDGKCSCNDYF